MSRHQQKAVDCFRSGFNCAQAVFSSCAPLLGLDEQSALRVAGGFGGGMGRLQEACGAVTGAFMLIGLKHGKTRAEDGGAKARTDALVAELAGRFAARHGAIRCRDLLGCDLRTAEGQAAYRDQEMNRLKCERYVADATALAEELLL
jgi:C_GCAxxG_C_C family probable redox protein